MEVSVFFGDILEKLLTAKNVDCQFMEVVE